MVKTEEKIWIVTENKADGTAISSAYDNEADANNYFIEMQARRNGAETVRMNESVLIRRADINGIASDESPWGTLHMDVKSEFVEGLMEEMAPQDKIPPGAAERFVSEKIDMVRKRAQGTFEQAMQEAMREELRVCMEEWCGFDNMEH